MKRFTYILFSLSLLAGPLYAQGEVDAARFSREDLHGTARAMSMGGAFGALGGDQTGVSINPAGIAVYRSSEVVGTVNLSQERSTVGSQEMNKTRFDMDNLGFVGYFPLRNDVMPLVNFGFSFNKLKSFNKNISAIGSPNSTMLDYIADRSAGVHPDLLQMGDNLPDPFMGDQPWLAILGYNSWLIDPVDDEGTFYDPVTNESGAINEIHLQERGYIDNYDFTVGTTFNHVLNLGLSLSIKDISYSLTSDYLEDFNNGGYTLTNWLTTSGAGVSAKIGAIYRPTNAIRFGLAYHTPTWYALSETYEAQIDDDMSAYVSDPDYEPAVTSSQRFSNDYDLKTPGKWVASMAGVFGNAFIASIDYELVDYSKMSLSAPSGTNDEDGWYASDNEYIAMDFKPASTVRLGMEYRFTPQFSGRVGYAWMQNPYESVLAEKGDAFIRNSNTVYRIEGDTNYFTGGIGYRFNRNFFLDLAVVYKTETDDLYPFPNLWTENRDELVIDASPFSLKNQSIRGLVTLGYKF